MTFVCEINLLIEIFKNTFLYKKSMFIGEKQKIQTDPLKHNPHTQIYNCQLFGVNSIRFYNIYNIYLFIQTYFVF